MTTEPTKPYNVLDTFSQEQWNIIAQRLKAARLAKNLTLQEVIARCKTPHTSVENLAFFEEHGRILAGFLIELCGIYDVPIAEILHGPLPYSSQQEWLDAYCTEAISITQLARGLGIGIIEAHHLVQEKGIE